MTRKRPNYIKTIMWIMLIIAAIVGISLAIYYGTKGSGSGGSGGSSINSKDSLLLKNLKMANDRLEYEKYRQFGNNKDNKIQDKFSFPIYYINLERSPERRKFMEKQFAEMGIMDKVTRINAIDGKNIKNIYQGNIQSIQYSANYIKKITQYELACTLSHLLSIKKAYDNGNNIALILEDDAYLDFAYFWPESLEKYTQKFPQDWEIIQVYPGDNSEKSKISDFRPWIYLKSWGCPAYLINRKGMEKIINRFFVSDLEIKLEQFTKVRLQADHVIYETAVTYVPNDALIVQFNDFKNMDSTIHKSDSVYQMKNAYKYMQNFINKLEQVNSGTVYNTIHIIDMSKSSTSPSPNISNNNNIVVWGSEDLKTLIKKQLSVIYDQIYQVRNPNINIFKFVLLYVFGGYYTDEYQKTKENMNVIPNKIMITNHFMYSPYKYHPFWKYCIKDILNIGNKFNLNNFQKIWEKEFPLDFYSKALSPIPEYRFYEPYETTDLYTGWEGYRLSDLFKYKKWRIDENGKNFHLSKYPKSIASEYLRSTNDEGNYKILSNIIRRRTNRYSIPDKNILVIQLRVGDVIDPPANDAGNNKTVLDFLKNGTNYVKPISYYEQLLPKIKRKSINKIILVAGSHVKLSSYNKSIAYINGIKEFFEKNGFKVELRLGKNPDDDIIFMSNAKWYIPGGGGFARILSELVNRNGGIVFQVQENFEPQDLYTGWEIYRLGDMFLNKSEREKDSYKKGMPSQNFHLSKYPKSIASEYLRSTNDEGNYKILSNIIIKRSNRNSIPDKNSLIVQLRVGDVIEDDFYSKGASASDVLNGKIQSKSGYLSYIKPISYYNQFLSEIKRKPINKIILVAGSHIKFPNYNKSIAYINGIKEFFEKNGFKVELRLGKNPDEDLIFMSNAKWYIPSGGGFSIILSKLIKRGSGTVFEHSKIEKFESPDLYTGWNLYRFGDMFRHQEWREKDPYGQGMSPRNFHLSKYPKSIASEYLRSTNDESNYKILSNIIKKRTNRNSIPDKNSLIVQLRVGDVIEQDNYTNGASASDFLNYETPTGATHELYVKPISYYNHFLPEIKRKPINKIILVGGSHIKFPNYNKSMAYIYGIKEFFEKNGFKVELRLGKNPDEDLIFISNSKWYIPAGGGFSVILSELVKRNGGGTVFES